MNLYAKNISKNGIMYFLISDVSFSGVERDFPIPLSFEGRSLQVTLHALVLSSPDPVS